MFFLIFFFITLCTTSIQINSIDSHMLKDMAVMMGAQMGASIANQAVSKEYEQASEAISTDQTNLNNASNSFFSNMQNIQSSQVTNISNIFSSAQTQVATLQKNQQKELSSIDDYMQAITSLNFPLSDYLDTKNTVLFDQLFVNSAMYTPQGVTWRNVFQVGDWTFDELTNSFWQLKEKQATDDAYKNCIFTEWNTNQAYEISCSITIYKVSYPFYVGVIFNKARWISGDTYGLEKYRTLGIYGDTNKKVSLCFAQQQIKKPVTATTPALPTSPLAQIYQAKGVQNFTLNQKAFDTLVATPITFHIKIKPSPTLVSYKIWSSGSVEPTVYTTVTTGAEHKSNFVTVTTQAATATQTAQTTKYLAQNDNDMYLYHGIGFLSPGAIAEFKLKGPQPLLFTPANLTLFTKEVENYYLNEKNKLLTKSL